MKKKDKFRADIGCRTRVLAAALSKLVEELRFEENLSEANLVLTIHSVNLRTMVKIDFGTVN